MTRLSLSGRLIEVQYGTCEMSVPEFMRFARACGYDAVELRATQVPSKIPPTKVDQFRRTADELGLTVSCCTPAGVTPDEGGLRGLEESVGSAQTLGCEMLKTWVKDVNWIRRACDLLRPRGLTLTAQIHTGGPFETVDGCLDTLSQIGRENFGLQYDPANLFEVQQDYGEEAVKHLGLRIHQLSVQSERLARHEEADTWEYMGRHYRRCPLSDPDGLDYASVFRGLRAIGFDGYVTLNEPKPMSVETEAFAKQMHDELRGWL